MPGAEHSAGTGQPGNRRRVNGGCLIVAMHDMRPEAPEFPVKPPDELAGGGTVHKDGKPLGLKFLSQGPALEQTMQRNLVSGSTLQTAERSHHGLGAADLHAIDYVRDSHFPESARHSNGDSPLSRRKSWNFLYRLYVTPGRAAEDFTNFAIEQFPTVAGELAGHYR